MLVPFMSQMATRPEVCRHRMSALPSPLKSPTPSIVQSSADAERRAEAADAGAVHEPDGDEARGVPPQDVGLAVAVEVADALDRPVLGPTPNGAPMLPMLVPFMSQMATSPEVCRHRMSALPSPLKSPTPWIVQSRSRRRTARRCSRRWCRS